MAVDNEVNKQSPSDPLFQLLSGEETNIDFQNVLEEGLNTNVLMYEYFYNGGGVATADFNGDDLIDIYFTSNMGENKFYINKGNMTFEDATDIAGVSGRPGPWKTGISHADVNGDGRLDLYLCYSGSLPEDKRQNQLFINNGNDSNGIPVFVEMAREYGLNSTAFSNQGYFFDYDRDGDLDMILLNHNPKSLAVLNETNTSQMITVPDTQRGVRLFQQNNDTFEDVTESAGVSGSALTYGLGIGIGDFNGDGWPDFYVSNDYSIPDYLYINSGNGTFSDELGEQIGHTSQFSMGNDVADYNNDGFIDILTLDMLPEDNRRQKLLMAPDNYAKFDLKIRSGFHHQYMRNMLQLNNGDDTFSEIGQLAGMDKTDWSWSALLADYDNDGWKDLYVTNGYNRDYTNLDYMKYIDNYVAKKGRLKREDVMALINEVPASDVINYAFKNKGDLTFENATDKWGMHHISNSNGAAYADLDNDGDLDLVVNNINEPAFIFQNLSDQKNKNYLNIKLQGEGKNTHGVGAKVKIISNGLSQDIYQIPTRGYLSTVSPVLHFGVGNSSLIDTLIITWPKGSQQIITSLTVNQTINLNETEAEVRPKKRKKGKTIFSQVPSPIKYIDPKPFIRDFDRQPLLISELSHTGPVMKSEDVNGDGHSDIYIGGVRDQKGKLFLGSKNEEFREVRIEFNINDQKGHDTDALFFDCDNDGDKDLYIARGGYHFYKENDPLLQDQLLINDGQGKFRKISTALPQMYSSTNTVEAADFNHDGFMDLFIGGGIVPGRYPESFQNYLLINDGKGNFTDQIETLAPRLQHLGNVTDALSIDVNSDGQSEIVVIGEWMPISIFVKVNGTLVNQTLNYFGQDYTGWWNTLEASDFNNDGQLDLIVGNHGSNSMYKASDVQPIELVYGDFDQNGSIDPFINHYKKGEWYPDVTRDELLGQLGHLRSRYTSYESYTDATISSILSKKELKSAKILKSNHLETSLFLSNNDMTYSIQSLPVEAQFAPVHVIEPLDYNNDGAMDILLCGNNKNHKLRHGKSDANYGVLLRGDNRGTFENVDQRKTGLQLKGDIKSIEAIDNYLIFGRNQESIITYKLN